MLKCPVATSSPSASAFSAGAVIVAISIPTIRNGTVRVGQGPDDTVESNAFLDTDELEAFIVKKLGIAEDVVSNALEAEDEFMTMKGIIVVK